MGYEQIEALRLHLVSLRMGSPAWGSDYSGDSGLEAGLGTALGVGRGFFAGLEMPMLIMMNLIPVRNVSIALIG